MKWHDDVMKWILLDWLTPVNPGKHHVNLFPSPHWRHSSGRLVLQPSLAFFPLTHQLFMHPHRPPHTPSTQSQSRVQCVAAAHLSSLPSAPRQKLSIHQRINYSTKEPPRHEEKKLEYPHLWGWGRGAKIGRREAVDYSIQHTHIWIGRAGLKLLSTLDKVAQKLVFGGGIARRSKNLSSTLTLGWKRLHQFLRLSFTL